MVLQAIEKWREVEITWLETAPQEQNVKFWINLQIQVGEWAFNQ